MIDLAILVRKNEKFDVVNVSTEETFSINEITSMIAKKMSCENIKIEYAETSHFWEKYPELYDKPYPITNELLEHEVLKYTCLSNEHAYLQYGWRPKTSIEDGIAKTVEFSVKILNKEKLKK